MTWPVPDGISEWKDVYIWSMDTHRHNQAIQAILDHLGCTLRQRWEPGKGMVMQCIPKEPPK